MTTTNPSKEQGRIQSLVRAFSILEIIAQRPTGIGLSELSRAVSLHNSTVFHLVKTMVTMGYVSQDEANRFYCIGGRLFHLAASSLNEVRLLAIVNPYVRNLARECETTCQFAVRSGDRAAVLVKGEGGNIFHSSERVGGSRPSYCTSLGKVILAGISQAELDEYLRNHELIARTPNTIVEPAQFRREIALVREKDIAFDDAEYHPELRCVAVPVRDFTQTVVGAIGISGPIWRLSLQALQSKADAVKETARRLSYELGYRKDLEAPVLPPASAAKQPPWRQKKRGPLAAAGAPRDQPPTI